MGSVYVVTQGVYEDYHIVDVWDSKAKAEARAKSIRERGWCNDHVEAGEWVLNAEGGGGAPE